MPRSPEKFEEIRSLSRERILRTALAMFARYGYERTTIRLIAAEAGISQGLLYNYFGNKAELLRAVFTRSMADVEESFAPLADEQATPAEKVAGLIRRSFEIVRRNQEFWRLSYSLRTQPAVLAEAAADVQLYAQAIRGQLTACFAAAGAPAPEIKAAILFAEIDGIAQHYVLEPDSYPLDAVLDELIAQHAERLR